MRILYVASDQEVPGRTGGSVHVLEVARGLAVRGHDVHVVIRRAAGQDPYQQDHGVHWHRIRWLPPHRFFRFRVRPAVAAIAASCRADVVIERYYNFGGEGIAAAAARGIPSLIEVNSPLLDHPGSLKAWIDRLLVFRPFRRYREHLCRRAAALVAPLAEIVPEFARAKTETVTWGANVDVFDPKRRSLAVRAAWGTPEGAVVVLFCGSFRPWHGVHVFEDAARRLRTRGDLFFVLVGGRRTGPASGYRGLQLGSVPYEQMPAIVASADVGVAPYDTTRLAQLQLGFYWSPFKIFEYMASGLPTITISKTPLNEIVREEEEALFFGDGDGADLARCVERLAADPALRARLGANARRRVVDRYSWAAHCRQIETVLKRIAA